MRTSAHEREFMLREENRRLREQNESLRDALLTILVRIEDANQPYERLGIGAVAREALYPASSPVGATTGGPSATPGSENPASDPLDWHGGDRCAICEGVDQPGLIHNPDAPYCSMGIGEQSPASDPDNPSGVTNADIDHDIGIDKPWR